MPDAGSSARPAKIEIPKDWARTYSDAENLAIALNLREITDAVYSGTLQSREPVLPTLLDMHAVLFRGVRSHAGKIRRPGFGSDRLTFGPHRSVERSRVPGELDTCFQQLQQYMSSFLDHPDDPQYEAKAVHVALWIHARIIRIHPFEDGNGRTSRLFANWILMKLGLPPVPVEVPKDEYISCLNHFYQTDAIQPLIDLYLSLYGRLLA